MEGTRWGGYGTCMRKPPLLVSAGEGEGQGVRKHFDLCEINRQTSLPEFCCL